MRALIIEDKAEIADCIEQTLNDMGIATDSFRRGSLGWQAIETAEYDLVVLDLNLPDQDGLGILKKTRASGNETPVLIISARTSIDDRVKGLDLGADDYLIKPFAIHELEARVRALLRRSQDTRSNLIEYAGLTFDQKSREFYVRERCLDLPPRERSVLEILIRQNGNVISKNSIAEHVFSFDDDASPSSIELYVHRLRKKLSEYRIGIETKRGRGYALSPLD